MQHPSLLVVLLCFNAQITISLCCNLIFLISMGNLLESFAASFLIVLDAIEDLMSGKQLDLRLLAFFQ